MVPLDILLVTFHHPDVVKRVVTLLYRYTTSPFRLLVADNGRDPQMLDFLHHVAKKKENVLFIQNSENKFCCAATNQLFSLCESPYIFYLCSYETFVVKPGWELDCLRAMETYPRAGIGGYLSSSKHYATGADYMKHEFFAKFRNPSYAPVIAQRQCFHVQGGFFILRKAMYDQIGGFNEALSHAYMDVEYSYYAESMGWELLPISTVVSLHRTTRPNLEAFNLRNFGVIHPLTIQQCQSMLPEVDLSLTWNGLVGTGRHTIGGSPPPTDSKLESTNEIASAVLDGNTMGQPSLSVREDIQYLSDHGETLTSLPKEQRTPQNPLFERVLEALENIQRALLDERPLPPPRLRYGTTGTYSIDQFYTLGAQTAELVHQLGNLRSNSVVLEVGAGAGRIALPLWWYLGEGGRFYGIDVNKKLVDHMQHVYGNARREFHYMDVYSERYNPKGGASPLQYKFEFADATFDVIYLSSVFTHMRLSAIAHYLQEFRRLLKPGGRVVFSAFLYDPILEEKTWRTSVYAQSFVQIEESVGEKSWTVNPQEPERTMAFLLASFKQRIEDAGLHLAGNPVWGRWTGNPTYTLWQDFVVAERPR